MPFAVLEADGKLNFRLQFKSFRENRPYEWINPRLIRFSGNCTQKFQKTSAIFCHPNSSQQHGMEKSGTALTGLELGRRRQAAARRLSREYVRTR
jgi:hypothetical protein